MDTKTLLIIGLLAIGLHCHEVWCFMAPCPWVCHPDHMGGGHTPVGFHSHSTHSTVICSEADLAWNKTRAGIRGWLENG
jgi:hypothetical protein